MTRDGTSLLLDVMNLGPTGIVDVVRTSDGHYLGQAPGDVGYNVYLGRPTPHEGPGRDRSVAVWAKLTPGERAALVLRATCPTDGTPIPLADFLGEEG